MQILLRYKAGAIFILQGASNRILRLPDVKPPCSTRRVTSLLYVHPVFFTLYLVT